MTREEFDVLIQRLEAVSRKSPRLYNARIVGLVALAYGYLALVLLGSLALCGMAVAMVIYLPNAATLKFGIIGLIAFGGIFVAVLRGLWVKLEPPKGQPVTRQQAPKLFALLDELRAALKCSPFHKVLLVGDYNAAVVQIPRLGVFGWHRNYLLVGLPLMQGLAPDELKAVLAHEFAHSSRGHGRFGNWLYRVRRTWDQVFQQMVKQRSRFGFALFKFIHWFWPIFNGHAFVLARANEYEADACSVRLAGADAAASALMRLPVDGSLLREQFWPYILARANTDQEPPANVVLAFDQALKTGLQTADASRWLRQALVMETNNADTHPCLKDRLREIGRLPAGLERGEFPPPPPPPTLNAARLFLGDHFDVVARQMSDEWRNAIAKQWAARYQQAKQLAADLAALEKPSDAPPTADQLWDKARKLLDLGGDAAALPVACQVLSVDPKHAAANFVLGRHHLLKDDPRGVEFIETAMSADPALVRDGCNLLYGHFTRTGQRDKLRPLEHRVDQFQAQALAAQRERAQVTVRDQFSTPELTERQVADLRKLFSTESELGSVAVARKQVQHFPKSPCFVLSLRVKVSWYKPRSSTANQQIVNRLVSQIKLPGNAILFVEDKNLKSLGKKIFAVPGSLVYQRPRNS